MTSINESTGHRIGRSVALLTIAAAFVLPIVIVVLTAVMTDRQVLGTGLWPSPFRFASFADAFSAQDLLREARNSALVTGLTVAGVLVSSVPAAYALACLRWRGRGIALAAVVATLLLPATISAVPTYALFAKLGLVGTLAPLVIPAFLGDAFAILLLRQFFVTVPTVLLDAARLEGAGEWSVLRRVVLPLCRPGVAATAVLTAFFAWNDFFGPLLYVGDRPESWTLSIGLSQMRTLHHVEWNTTLAASILVALPLVAVFVAAQRALTDSIAAGGHPV